MQSTVSSLIFVGIIFSLKINKRKKERELQFLLNYCIYMSIFIYTLLLFFFSLYYKLANRPLSFFQAD